MFADVSEHMQSPSREKKSTGYIISKFNLQICDKINFLSTFGIGISECIQKTGFLLRCRNFATYVTYY
jgi:hypothetical protein